MEQEPMWVVEKYDPNNPFYEIPGSVMMEGDLDIELLERSTNEVVKRHEILRAVFTIHEDKPVQYIFPSITLPLQRVDLKDLPVDEQEYKLKELREDRGLYSFDLAKGPLIKTLLVELGKNKYIFITIMHHIIGDLLSLKLFLKEAAWFYVVFSQGKAPGYDLPGLPFQYVDYACWAQRWFRESIIGIEARKKQEEFWLDIYREESPAANLPLDYPRPAVKQYEGDHLYFVLKEKKIEALKEIVLKENATLYIILFTIYYVFLAKITGQEDIVVGTPINTRQSAALNNMIGLFVKTAALRNYPAGNKTFRNFLIEVNQRILNVYKNQDYQYEELVRKILTKRDPSRNPLFDVIFNFIYIGVDDIDMPGLKVTPYRFKTNRIGFDLELVCEGTYKELRLKLSYCTKLFKEETAVRFVSYIQKIIGTVIHDPDVKLSEIDIIPAQEKKRLLIEFNDTAADYPEAKTIIQWFEMQAAKTPDHTAAVFKNQRLSYRGLLESSSRLAGMLREKGVGPDVIVGLMVKRSLEMLIGIIGILRAGGAYLPIDPEYPGERIDYILKESSAGVLVSEVSKLREVRGGVEVIDLHSSIVETEGAEPTHSIHPTHLCYAIYTSGSTGKPKGAAIDHKNVVNFINGVTAKIEFSTGKSILALTTISFDIFVLETLLPLVKGLTVVIASESQQRGPLLLAEKIVKDSVNMVQVTPSSLRLLIEGGAGLSCLDNVEVLMVGGERFPTDLLERLRHDYKGYIYNMYGPTETTIWSSIRDLTRAGKIDIGKPIANTQVYIVDNWFRLLPIGIAGKLYIAGDGLARGYINQPELTAEKFDHDLWDFQDYRDEENYQKFLRGSRGQFFQKEPPGRRRLYQTGDLARWLPDGNIEFFGRLDHQVKIRGNRIELEEIENRLMNHSDIREAVVLARADEVGGNYLCSYIAGEREFEVPELRDYLAGALPEYMIPSYFLQMEKLPLTPNGKIDRKALPEPDTHHIHAAAEYVGPRNRVEETLVQLWAEELNIERIGIDDNFFELGGHSLRAAILTAKIQGKLNVRIPLAEMSRIPTIRGLSAYIAGAPETPFIAVQPVEEKEYYALSPAQQRLYFLDRFETVSTGYNMPTAFQVVGELDKKRFTTVLHRLIQRHDVLRTSFHEINSEPVQRIHKEVHFEIEYDDALDNAPDANCCAAIIENFIRPFDLTRAPLLRAGLVKISQQQHLLFFDMHHVIADGTAMGILVKEFSTLYNRGTLQPPRIQYKDFSQWQINRAAGGETGKQEEYWLNLYPDPGEIPRLELPGDYPRPDVFTFEGDTLEFSLDNRTASAFGQLCNAMGATLYMGLLTALNILLYRYGGQEDVIVGSGIAGRNHEDLENLIGLFVNMLALRNHPAREKTLKEFFREVQENSFQSFENQDVQFEDLVSRLDLRRDPSRNPLFDICFVVQNFELPELHAEDIIFKPYRFENKTAKFDITLFTWEIGDEIHFTMEYYTAIFKPGTIHRMKSHFLKIVEQMVDQPDVTIGELDFLSGMEKQQLLVDFNSTEADFPGDRTIHELFIEQAERTPDHIAVVGIERRAESVEQLQITYGELDEKSNRVARYLLYRQNVQADDCVGILMDSSLDLVVAILGTLKTGTAYLPIDPFLPEERIRNVIDDSSIKILVSQKRFIRTLNRLQWECESFSTYLCMDTMDIYAEQEVEKSRLMDKELWEYVGKRAADDIEAGGWLSSYTGEPIPAAEMDEYGDNALQKLDTLLHPRMRVVEIGCASGLTMYRAAPRVGYYLGTDLSDVIIEKNRERIKQEKYQNIALQCLAAHEIDSLKEQEQPFDLVIMNSVVQTFHGHNYLRQVIRKSIDLLGDRGYLFIGDIMDRESKQELIRDLLEFQRTGREGGNHYKTKTVFSEELFISRGFFRDLAVDMPVIRDMEFSSKIHTIENELTKFRYDVLIRIDKNSRAGKGSQVKHKYQEDLRVLGDFAAEPAAAKVNPGNLAYVIYTSGSTGRPRGVMVEHRSLVNLCWWHNCNFSVTASDRAPKYAGLGFDASVWEIFPYLVAGASLYIIDDRIKLEIEKLNHYFDIHNITIGFLPTQMCEQFMLAGYSPVSLRVLLTGGDKLQRYVKRSYRLVNNYGPTENAVVTTSCVVDRNRENIPIGKPVSNTRVYILGRDNHLQPIGIPGELCIAGAGLARGYLNSPELTAEKFRPVNYRSNKSYRTYNFYQTGDLARWLADGNIEFMGRVDQQVKIRGYRIEPGEIENLLSGHEEIGAAVVVPREQTVDTLREVEEENEAGAPYLCAYYVVAKTAVDGLDAGVLKEYLSRKLPAYMVPRYFVKIDEIPLTANGKVDRKALPDPGARLGPSSEGYEPPGNEMEEKMVGIWQGVLGIHRPGINDDFFEIGGDSIKAIQVTARLRSQGLELKISDLFLHPTVKESVKYVVTHREVGEGEELSTPGDLELFHVKPEKLEVFEDEFSDID
jgi:amino acid adenylation domain-containing protein